MGPEHMPTRDAISDEAVPITEVTASGNGGDDSTAAVVIPAAAVAAIEEEQEVLHSSIRSASLAQMVIAIIAVLGLFISPSQCWSPSALHC